MNTMQKSIAIVAAVIAAILLAYVPVVETRTFGGLAPERQFASYQWLWAMTGEMAVNFSKLGCELLAVAVVGGAVWFSAKKKA